MRAGFAPRDLLLVVAGVGGLTALAWFDLWRRGTATDMAIPQPMPWSVPDLFAAGAMWSIMMIAMMLPSATPMLARRRTVGCPADGRRYGAYSVGCCRALMGLLLVVGVMNLLWIAALSIYVLGEKTVLRGPWPGRAAGAVLIAWALYLFRMSAV